MRLSAEIKSGDEKLSLLAYQFSERNRVGNKFSIKPIGIVDLTWQWIGGREFYGANYKNL